MLTDAALRNLKPKSKTYQASDRDGMSVTVSPSGTVTFRYDYRFNGRRETLTLGRDGPDGISLAMADGARTAPGRAENRPQGHITCARKATRETPGGRHQDLRHGARDRHQFRFIVSPEDAEQLDDLRTYTRHLMARMKADLGTRLEWGAVDHGNTDNPHTHVVLRGKDNTGKDLIISRNYIAEGMRRRASELATEWLGPRTELEMQRAMQRMRDVGSGMCTHD